MPNAEIMRSVIQNAGLLLSAVLGTGSMEAADFITVNSASAEPAPETMLRVCFPKLSVFVNCSFKIKCLKS